MSEKTGRVEEIFSANQIEIGTDSIQCANWDNSKGNPFEFDTFGNNDIVFTVAEPIIKIIDEYNIIDSNLLLYAIDFYYNIKLLHSLSFEQSDLLIGYKDNKLKFDVDDYIDKDLPLKVYLRYPFSKIVCVEIPNVLMDGEISYYSFGLGYILWQISNAYAKIYKDMWEEIGVWGHSLCDLMVGELQIYKNNIMTVLIDS